MALSPMLVGRLAGLGLALICIGYGASTSGTRSPSSSASSTPLLTGAIRLTFTDEASRAACPPHSPAGAECSVLTATSDQGRWRLGPILDVEVPPGSRECGATVSYRTRLTASDGSISILERGPRLCIGVLGRISRTFTVSGGTGQYTDATGAGTIALIVQSVGATEIWSGHITVPTS